MAANTADAFYRLGCDDGDDVMDGWFVHGRYNAKSVSICLANKSTLRQKNWQAKIAPMKELARPYLDIAERLLWHRNLTGLSQEFYAEKISMKRARYSLWEAGTHRLSLDGSLALRNKWGLSLDFMFAGIDDALPMTLRSAWRDRPQVSNSKKSIVNPEP